MGVKRLPLTLKPALRKQSQTPIIHLYRPEDYDYLRTKADEKGYFTLDFETTSLAWYKPEEQAVYAALVIDGHSWVFDSVHIDACKHLVNYLLSQPTITIIGHNIKFDLHWKLGLTCDNFKANTIDTMVGAFLLDENNSVAIDALVYRLYGVRLKKYKDIVGKIQEQIPADTKKGYRLRTRQRRMDECSLDEVKDYVTDDAFWTEYIWFNYVLPNLKSEPDLYKNFFEIQMPLLKVLWAMEERGVEVDVEQARKLSKEYQSKIVDIEATLQSNLVSRGISELPNFRSPEQLDNFLYNSLGNIRPPFKTKRKEKDGTKVESKYDTGKLQLIWLAQEQGSDEARLLLKHRRLSKLKSTYLNSIIENNINGRIHTNFNMASARTGRLSSSEPINLQNIPRESNIRALFKARPGHKLLRADLSQAELRILAHYSKDEALVGAYLSGHSDLHWDTAVATGLSEILSHDDARFSGKTGNFSMVYGVWADTFRYTLYEDTEGRINLSREQAIQVIRKLNDERFKGISRWKNHVLQNGRREQGSFITIDKRKRRLDGITSNNYQRRSYAERQGINSIIQGSVGDIIGRLMAVNLFDYTFRYGVLQVHDELVWEIAPELEGQFLGDLRGAIMDINRFYGLTVPLEIEYNVGERWSK